MAEVIHRYVGRGEQFVPAPREETEAELERAKLDAEWRRKRIDAESARQNLHEAKLLAMRKELISRVHVTKQAGYLAICLRQQLLAIAQQHASELLNIDDVRAMQQKLDAIIRAKLDTIADFAQRVTDEKWFDRLDDDEQPRRAKRKLAK